MTQEELKNILKAHKKWLNNEDGGIRANLRGANLRGANLRGTNLRYVDLSHANLKHADLRYADLSEANLNEADLSHADLNHVDLRYADLRGADLFYANLCGANLSGVKGLLGAINYMEAHFERTEHGYIAYKTFGVQYSAPENWEIKPGAVIEENVNMCRADECGCGINVAPLDWVRKNYNGEIWKVLIRWEWLVGVCVPYNTDGKIRCERVQLLEIVK